MTDLPVPWSETYRIHHQDFSPYGFMRNARQIAAAITMGGEAAESYRKALPYLMRQLDAHTEAEAGGLAFVVYRFDLDVYWHTIKSGWRSAFGNAVIMLGLLDLFQATGDQALRERAERYLSALLAVNYADGITEVDDSQYLWFEEYPKPAEHLINGHIITLLALYHWGQELADDRVNPLLTAGLTTMRRYLPMVRRAGGVSAYGLFDLSVADYGPQRTINLVRAIAKISGDAEFDALAAAFETDMPLPAQ